MEEEEAAAPPPEAGGVSEVSLTLFAPTGVVLGVEVAAEEGPAPASSASEDESGSRALISSVEPTSAERRIARPAESTPNQARVRIVGCCSAMQRASASVIECGMRSLPDSAGDGCRRGWEGNCEAGEVRVRGVNAGGGGGKVEGCRSEGEDREGVGGCFGGGGMVEGGDTGGGEGGVGVGGGAGMVEGGWGGVATPTPCTGRGKGKHG